MPRNSTTRIMMASGTSPRIEGSQAGDHQNDHQRIQKQGKQFERAAPRFGGAGSFGPKRARASAASCEVRPTSRRPRAAARRKRRWRSSSRRRGHIEVQCAGFHTGMQALDWQHGSRVAAEKSRAFRSESVFVEVKLMEDTTWPSSPWTVVEDFKLGAGWQPPERGDARRPRLLRDAWSPAKYCFSGNCHSVFPPRTASSCWSKNGANCGCTRTCLTAPLTDVMRGVSGDKPRPRNACNPSSEITARRWSSF